MKNFVTSEAIELWFDFKYGRYYVVHESLHNIWNMILYNAQSISVEGYFCVWLIYNHIMHGVFNWLFWGKAFFFIWWVSVAKAAIGEMCIVCDISCKGQQAAHILNKKFAM